jgi:hypothetical protein
MRNSDIPTMNLFATAYVKPIYDVPSGPPLTFVRNYQTAAQAVLQLEKGQSTKASSDYWFVYMQAGFQGRAFERKRSMDQRTILEEMGDCDPVSEVTSSNNITRGTTLAETLAQGIAGSERQLGTVLYLESIKDQARNAGFDCIFITPVHEVGHQFDLDHKDPDNPGLMESDIKLGIMSSLCGSQTKQEFIKSHIKLIRNAQRPQKNNN